MTDSLCFFSNGVDCFNPSKCITFLIIIGLSVDDCRTDMRYMLTTLSLRANTIARLGVYFRHTVLHCWLLFIDSAPATENTCRPENERCTLNERTLVKFRFTASMVGNNSPTFEYDMFGAIPCNIREAQHHITHESHIKILTLKNQHSTLLSW